MFPENYIENIGAHHSSLSKEYRFEIEEKLRKGELKVVVTSSSLELGIDIGYIDLVVLLGSPKGSARALQRIGRAGHKLHDISKGRFLVLDRDDLVECSILNKECVEKRIDKIHIPRNCLDVLSQQIYGMCIQKIWDIDEMFKMIKKSYCYSELNKEDFMSVISYLAGEYALEHRNVYAKIWYDKETKQLGKRGKLARVIYMTNIGTIPEESFVTVVIGQGERRGNKVGMVDEPFLEKMKPGDVFVLGGRKYQFLYTKGMKAYVKDGIKRNPTIPSWFSEQMPLSFDSAVEIGKFRKMVNDRFEKKMKKLEIVKFIKEHCYLGDGAARSIYNYFYEQYKFAKLPHSDRILVEHYKGEKNYVIFHSLYGRRVNDALSRALGLLMGHKVGRDIEIGINDNGFYFAGENLPIEEALNLLSVDNLQEALEEAISKTEVLKRRFRHCAARSLMILRNYKGRSKSVGKQQMNSFFLLSAINKISRDFPILKEARREVLEDLMDIDNAKMVLGWIKDGKVKIDKIHTKLPSPFALNLVMQGYSDLLKIEDKMKFLKRMHKEILREIGE
jgi:ATP-dependent Lhr-like helicase